MKLEKQVSGFLDEIRQVCDKHGFTLAPTYISSGLNVEERSLGENNFQDNLEKLKTAIVISKGEDKANVFFQTQTGLEYKEALNLKIYSDHHS